MVAEVIDLTKRLRKKDNDDLGERLRRINESMQRINQLMKELRNVGVPEKSDR